MRRRPVQLNPTGTVVVSHGGFEEVEVREVLRSIPDVGRTVPAMPVLGEEHGPYAHGPADTQLPRPSPTEVPEERIRKLCPSKWGCEREQGTKDSKGPRHGTTHDFRHWRRSIPSWMAVLAVVARTSRTGE